MNHLERTAFAGLVVLLAAGIGIAEEAASPPTGKLMVVWTSADPDLADKDPATEVLTF